MAYRRNDNGNVQYRQVGQWQSPPVNGKPPLQKPFKAERFSEVPDWEKKFCYSVGSVPWKKVIDVKKSMFMHPNVVKWNDFAVKEAFDNAKNRFYAKIKGLRCNIPLPDPNIYIDDVDWNAPVDPELYLDLDEEAEALHIMEEKVEEPVLLDRSILLDKSFSRPGWPEPTGWGDEEVTKPSETTKTEEPFILTRSFLLDWSFTCEGRGPTGWGDEGVTKPSEPYYVACGWEPNQHQNYETNSWEQQYHAPVDQPAKDYGWRQTGHNDYQGRSQGWNQGRSHREQYGGGLHNKHRGRNGGSGHQGKWGVYNRKKDNNRENNMSLSKKARYHHGANDYQTKKPGYHNGANDYQTKKPGYHHGANDYQTKKHGYHNGANYYQTKKPGDHHGANDYQAKKPGYHYGAIDYQTNGGRKRNGGGGGGRRENFGYADKVAPSSRW